jgi:hypothetical protein
LTELIFNAIMKFKIEYRVIDKSLQEVFMNLFAGMYEDGTNDALRKFDQAQAEYDRIKKECKQRLKDAEAEWNKARDEFIKLTSTK